MEVAERWNNVDMKQTNPSAQNMVPCKFVIHKDGKRIETYNNYMKNKNPDH